MQITTAATTNLQRTMAAAGWEINYVDLDLTGSAPKVEIKVSRADGRWIWARIDGLGRCTVETFQRERGLAMDQSRKGRRPLTPMAEDRFLGRTRHEGPRSMLRHVTNYLADNADVPVLLADMRSAWAGVMSAPALISAA